MLRRGDEVDVVLAHRVGQVLGNGVAQRLLAGGGEADAGLEHLARHLARAEPGQLDLVGDLAERRVDVAVELGFVDGHRELDELLCGCVFRGVHYGRDRAIHRSSMLPVDLLIGQTVTMTYWKPHALAKPHADQLDLRMGDRVESTVDLDGRRGRHRGQGHPRQRVQLAALPRAVRQRRRGRRPRPAQHRADRARRQAPGQGRQARLNPGAVRVLRPRSPVECFKAPVVSPNTPLGL